MTRLAAMLAIATGKQKKLCEDFLKEIFRIVADELANGENVRIKGFGTFKLTFVEPRKSVNVATGEEHEIPGHSKIIFVAAKELASIVNSPFEAFDAVEIADDIPTDEILEFSEESESDDDVKEDEVQEVLDADFEATEVGIEDSDKVLDSDDVCASPEEEMSSTDSEPGTLSHESLVVSSFGEGNGVSAEDGVDGSSSMEYESRKDLTAPEGEDGKEAFDDVDEDSAGKKTNKSVRRTQFLWGAVAGFIVCGLVNIAYYYFFNDGGRENNKTEIVKQEPAVIGKDEIVEDIRSVDSVPQLAAADTVSAAKEPNSEAVPTKPSDEKVYDTVTTTRFLTTMAKEHYGNFNLWPIIYEENASFLGHPDRIKPGTKVVVPPLSKYGIDVNNPEDIKKIKQKGVEIYSKYK